MTLIKTLLPSLVACTVLCACATPDTPSSGAAGNPSPAPAYTRTLSSIQLAFDRDKRAIIGIYNQEFRAHPPAPEGTIAVGFTIEANGSVSECHVVYDGLNNAEFSSKIVDEVRSINFGPGTAQYIVDRYPLSFHPS